MNEEIFDVCDPEDRVIGQAPRPQVHARGLLHRAVHIWIWNRRGELLIHLRTPTKDEFPSCYTSSASGHLATGEEYEAAAQRELEEELGLRGELDFVVKLPGGPETANEHTALYFLTTDELPRPDPEEIAALRYLSPAEILRLIDEAPQRFTPPFRALMNWWRGQQSPPSRRSLEDS